MTRMLSKISSPRRPWRKGVLAFSLACLTLWGAMLAAEQVRPARFTGNGLYALDGAQWQGITQIDIQGLESSGQIYIMPGQAPRIETRWDDTEQAQLQLRRQGNTLIVAPKQSANTKPEKSAARYGEPQVRIANFYLPAGIDSIRGQSLDLRINPEPAQTPPLLQLSASDIRVRGAVRQLRVQLLPFADTSRAGCAAQPGREPQIYADIASAVLLDISAPDGSDIHLDISPEQVQQIARLRLQTGEASRLNLGSLALLEKLERLPAAKTAPSPATATSTADCPRADAYAD